jgi:hypothetical protein
MSRLACGNAEGRTHSETSSNSLCTNDELGNWRYDPKSSARLTAWRGTSNTEREFPSDKVYRRDDRGIVGVESLGP